MLGRIRIITHRLSLTVSAVAILVASTVTTVATSQGVNAAAGDAKVISENRVDANTIELRVQSPSIDGWAKKVRVIVPNDWSKTATKKWPAVWLLHGGLDDSESWITKTDVKELAIASNVMVVMPDTSWCSAYSDWYNGGAWGKPAWETYITEELRFLMDRSYNADGSNASVAGLSMGGLGSTKFAIWHPDMFKGVATFSGNVDPLHEYDGRTSSPNKPGGGCLADWKRVWGDYRDAEEVKLWERNDPYIQAHHLAQQKYIYVASGDGLSNPLDAGGLMPDPVEQEVHREGQAFVAKLQSLNIPVDYHFYPGNHSWPYWNQELRRAWPGLVGAINQ